MEKDELAIEGLRRFLGGAPVPISDGRFIAFALGRDKCTGAGGEKLKL